MTTIKKISENENGVTWYEITGNDFKTNTDFENEIVGITCEENPRVLDCDGCPVTQGDWFDIAVRNILKI
ncbi:hypothetical protein [Neptunicella sp.]|uniref:hypothetical protein n=1 Tax=Neptunicella sp. TaxID=2125986 RepID=UPI003F68EF76